MNRKISLLLLLFLALTVCLVLTFAVPRASQNSQQAEQGGQRVTSRPALKQDLVSTSGEKILEIIEASYQLTENTLDSSSCRVRNLSGKNITAVGLVWTVKFSDRATWQTEQILDYRIHKDIVEAKGVRPFAPYEEKVIPRLTKETFEEGQSIESVKVEFAFVEFENSGGVGTENSEMYKHLLLKREGVEMYKRWMEDIYGDDPERINLIIGKLSGDELPGDKQLEDEMVKQGALIYKRWMLGVLKDKGADSLQKLLNR